ncbi:glycosyltransferase [uncultured Sphingobacterium sp.]|uniref:glycosyltransferase n=1 Tax=uncultured Sphingobacterium sp. TaxID=182688 RepID=UPI0025F1F8D7|nr:glycosyltransferase [uncultured Sphingobacterium sp.]
MEKICFVVCQFGKEVNGGAEIHCKMLAERLSEYYDIDILTSKVINYNTFDKYYTNSQESINNINVLRFDCIKYDNSSYNFWWKKSKSSRKVRRTLFRFGLLKPLANIFPVWNLGIENEKNLLQNHGFYSPDMLSFLEKNYQNYKKILFMSYPYPHTVFGAGIMPSKSILIPTAHNEGDLFRSIQTHLFTKVRHIAFNTEEEQNLASRVFGKKMSPHSIVAVGVETELPESVVKGEDILNEFGIKSPYLHYFGRICDSKMGHLIEWFISYKRKNPSDLKLVLTGRIFQEQIRHADVIYTGFVTEFEKIILIKNAKLIINPSKNESLSLLLLEAMNLGKMVLVNGKSDVMKGHCIKSGYAAAYYLNKKDFQAKIHKYAFNEKLLLKNSNKAREYVNKNYNWTIIINKLKHIIDTI